MALKCGIVGLPNVGKSTLFNALTSAKALAANYPFATKEPNIGIITVPDPRLDKLAEIVVPQKVQPTTVEIVDIAGLIKGASKGEGLGNQFLATIREVNAIVYVVRCFDDDNIVHVEGSVDPVRDKLIIDSELLLKDLETIEKRIDRYKKNARGGEKAAVRQLEVAEQIYNHVENGSPARLFPIDNAEDLEVMEEMLLLSAKPILYVCNVTEDHVLTGNAHTEAFKKMVVGEKAEVILICAQIEAEIAELDTKEERQEFIESMGLDEAGVNKVIRASYTLLDLITYFTAGVKEVRAWTIGRGWKAPAAAGVIHSDFERGFIRAEVIKYNDYTTLGSEKLVKEAGKMRLEGKEYVVEDGDIMHFLFNV
ncbi:MAG: redox-regulated ATPase YchF [Bacteroidota bacterium]|jgi:GTP-binding protein YchF